jgi:hypothetical protein
MHASRVVFEPQIRDPTILVHPTWIYSRSKCGKRKYPAGMLHHSSTSNPTPTDPSQNPPMALTSQAATVSQKGVFPSKTYLFLSNPARSAFETKGADITR